MHRGFEGYGSRDDYTQRIYDEEKGEEIRKQEQAYAFHECASKRRRYRLDERLHASIVIKVMNISPACWIMDNLV